MKTYWDSSALVEAYNSPQVKARLESEGAFTRPHALAETFSTLTGNPANRIDADSAARVVQNLSHNLKFVDLTSEEVLRALVLAQEKGVRGGRVHDYLHAVAATKCGAKKILTLDKNDFAGLSQLVIELA